MKIQILSVAQQEVEEASDYYENQHGDLRHDFVLAFEQTLRDIEAFPGPLVPRLKRIAGGGGLSDFRTVLCFASTKERSSFLRSCICIVGRDTGTIE